MFTPNLNKIIVTGGAGYIGSHIVNDLLEYEYKVLVLDNMSNSNSLNIDNILVKKNVKNNLFVLQEGCESVGKFSPENIGGIIHLAAFKNVGESVKHPLKYYNNNINSLLNVLNYVKKYHIPNLIFSSSCTVYGEPDKVPVNENESIKESPSPYGQSKIMCERILKDFYAENRWVNILSLRYFNPIGCYSSVPIGENPKGGYESLMSRLNRWIFHSEDFKIYGDDYDTPDGSAIRDYLDVGDLSRCHIECLRYIMQKDGFYDYYNVGTGVGVSVKDLVNKYLKINNIVNKNVEVADRRKGDVDKIFADPSKIQNDIGFKCVVPLEESLKNSYEYGKYLLNKY